MFRETTLMFVGGLGSISCSYAPAQEVRATIGGRVTDSQGGAIAKAAVIVNSDDTNVHFDT
jgi:hypothetical protein